MADSSDSISYGDSGVNIDAGEALVDAIRPAAKRTLRAGADSELGGFGGLFDLRAAGYKDPILVAATDGVGTKLKIAVAMDRYDSVGIDLVAMCVNDLVVQGAEPLFFLDYYATGALDVAAASQVIDGIAKGCELAGCALIGGETAEMPGMYAGGDFDLAGFAVGAMERGKLIDGRDIAPGDIVLGMASSGVHSNGFSLVRKLLETNDLTYSNTINITDFETIGDALIEPTRVYVKACLEALSVGGIKAFAHITGGGLIDNIPRVLPDGLLARVDADKWELPAVFTWLNSLGKIPVAELVRTFNCGIGMVAIVGPDDVARVQTALEAAGEQVTEIGRIEKRPANMPASLIESSEDRWGMGGIWSTRSAT